MKTINYFILLLLIYCVSCKKQSESVLTDKNTLTFYINFSDSEEEVKIIRASDFTDSVSYIKLETKKECLIANIHSIKFVKGKIYILDTQLPVLYIFNASGKYISKLDKSGKGPGEYISLTQFDVDPENEQIHILDGVGKKMLVYSPNGDLIKSFHTEDFIRDFAYTSNCNYLYYTPDYNMGEVKRGLWKVGADGEFKEQLVSIDPDFRYGGLYPKYFQRINRETLGLLGGEDKDFIYHIVSGNINVAYRLKVNIDIPSRIKKSEFFNAAAIKGRAYTKNNYFETNRYLHLNINNYESNVTFLYDKTKNKTILNANGAIANDLDSIAGLPLGYTHDNAVVFSIPELLIVNSKEIRDRLNVSLEDNPVLQIYHLKK